MAESDSSISKSLGRCLGCGGDVAPVLLACPACGRLVHAERLALLAADGERAEAEAREAEAVFAWRSALELLPVHAPQAALIRQRVDALSARLEAAPARGHGSIPKWLAPLGAVGLLLWKFKFVLAFVLTKGKLLLLGLTKGSTFFSMLLAMGVYWTLWGWKFAVGFIAMIYVHEMGHVAALHRLGIRASAPMFVPGLGAFVRLDQYPASAREDARIGLAGPIWGLAAAVSAYALHLATGYAVLAGIAHAGAVVNLFNLIPVWQLDGSRGLRALARRERILVAVLVGAAFLWTSEGVLLL
ncbi:site-2 protease family protein, partial [Myxococcota bacterium]|nr:site-2 protease family protein [Myxococcota bacterium]